MTSNELNREVFELYLKEREPLSQHQWSESELTQHLLFEDNKSLFVTHEMELISFVCYRSIDHIIEIIYLETHSRYRGLGLMSDLLKLLIEQNNQSQIWLDVHEHNSAALSLYKKLGFIKNGYRKAYYRDGGGSLLLSRPRVLKVG